MVAVRFAVTAGYIQELLTSLAPGVRQPFDNLNNLSVLCFMGRPLFATAQQAEAARGVLFYFYFLSTRNLTTMADTTSQADAPATPPNGQADPASAQAPQSPATPTPAPASTTDKPEVVSVNDFRRMQSVLTQREQAAARAAQQAQAQLQQMQQRLAQLETKDMEPEEAERYQANQYIQQLQNEIRQRDYTLQAYDAQQKSNEALYRMSQKTGVPFSELRDYWSDNANRTADDVWEYAVENTVKKLSAAQVKAGEKAAAQLEDADATARKEEREVDLGNGKAPRDENPFDSALKAKDAQAFVKAYLLRNKQ
jgi:cob(I)alamin adenosyltransferase